MTSIARATLLALLCSHAAVTQAHRLTVQRLSTLDAGFGAFTPESWAVGISADGVIVAGSSTSLGGYRAFRWTSALGLVSLGTLPGHDTSYANAISADGLTIVGRSRLSTDSGPSTPFKWDASGMRALPALPGSPACAAMAVSADGTVVVGYCGDVEAPPGGRLHAVRWTDAGGVAALPELPGTVASFALDVSDDGRTVVGRCDLSPAPAQARGVLWRPDGTLLDLGGLANTGNPLQPVAISADGTVVVGIANDVGGSVGARWDAGHGVQPMAAQYFSPCDLTTDGGTVIGQGVVGATNSERMQQWQSSTGLVDLGVPGCASRANAVSRDGRIIAGALDLPSAAEEAAVVRVEPDCTGVGGDLAPGTLDTSTTPPTWRPSGDGSVNIGDVVVSLRAAVGLVQISCAP